MRSSAAREAFSRQFIVSTRPWSLRSSGTMPTPAASIFETERSFTGWPFTKTFPVAAGSRPKMAWAISVRPAPTKPASPTTSPVRMVKLMSLNLPREESFSTRKTSSPSASAT